MYIYGFAISLVATCYEIHIPTAPIAYLSGWEYLMERKMIYDLPEVKKKKFDLILTDRDYMLYGKFM